MQNDYADAGPAPHPAGPERPEVAQPMPAKNFCNRLHIWAFGDKLYPSHGD